MSNFLVESAEEIRVRVLAASVARLQASGFRPCAMACPRCGGQNVHDLAASGWQVPGVWYWDCPECGCKGTVLPDPPPEDDE